MKNKKVRELLDSFNEISGMEICLANKGALPIYYFHRHTPSLCELIHSLPGGLEVCMRSDKAHISELFSGGEGGVFTCPFGLCELLVPVRNEGAVRGFIFCSMGINRDAMTDDAIKENVLTLLPDADPEIISAGIKATKHLTSSSLCSHERLVRLIGEAIEHDELIEDENESIGSLIKSYIRANLCGRITIADIAYHLHCSTVTITQHFKAEFGITVMQYVTKKRLAIAEGLLRETEDSIKSIALQSGFDEAEYFSRLFHRHYGATPTEYRIKNRAAKSQE